MNPALDHRPRDINLSILGNEPELRCRYYADNHCQRLARRFSVAPNLLHRLPVYQLNLEHSEDLELLYS